MSAQDLRFSKSHEWVRITGKRGIIGISDHAQTELGDIVFVELPQAGDEIQKGDQLAVVESVKAVSDIYSPLTGVVLEVNETLEENPERINEDPYGDGWLVVLEVADADEAEGLMEYPAYIKFVEAES